MEINSNLSLLISIPLQSIVILAVNFFWLGYKVTRRDIFVLLLLVIFPSTMLFIYFDSLAVFYLLFSLIGFLHYKIPSKVFILHVFVSFILAVMIDHAASLISLYSLSSIQSELIFIILRNILFCGMLAIAAYGYKKIFIPLFIAYLANNTSLSLVVFLIFLTSAFFYFTIAVMPNKSMYASIQTNLWILMIYFALTILLAASIIFVSFQRYQFRQKEKEYENFLNYVQLLEQVNENTRRFKHDYINILSSLRHYIDDRDLDGLRTYFYDNILVAHKQEIHNDLILHPLHHLKIPGLKGLLTTKIMQAQEQQIQVHLEVSEEITSIHMNIIELNRMLGILLDNAIEASAEVESPLIRIAFIRLEASVIIIILNKISENLDIKVHEVHRAGFSTKGEHRGLGLATLKEIVNANKQIASSTKIEPPYFIQELEVKN